MVGDRLGKPSQRIVDVQTPVIPVVGEWVREHPGTISLGQGIVHYPPPASVGRAIAQRVIDDGRLGVYGHVGGDDELLTAIRKKVYDDNGIEADERLRVVVTCGSNMGFVNAVLAVADVDDEVILIRPYYFNHEMAIGMLGCRAVVVASDEQYRIDVDAIEAAMTERTRAVVTVSPCNPTGVVSSPESLEQVNQLCKNRGVYHISDEAYEYFVYGNVPHFSPGSLPNAHEHTISLYSLSKSYGMAGWRAAYMIVPSDLETSVKKIQDTNLVCPPRVTQVAATEALNAGRAWCEPRIAKFQEVRDLVLNQLAELGNRVVVPRPDGAFYVFLRLDTERDDMDLVHTLIRDYGVAVMPGSTFGARDGCTLRIAYGALARDSVADGMGRLTRGLRSLL